MSTLDPNATPRDWPAISRIQRGIISALLVALIAAASIVVTVFVRQEHPDRAAKFATADSLRALVAPAQRDRLAPDGASRDLFYKRLETFRSLTFELNATLASQLLLVIATIAIVIRPRSHLVVPLVGYDIPSPVVYWALPLAIGYFWMRMGYLFNALIENRIGMWRLAEAFEGTQAVGLSQDSWNRLLHTFSVRPLLRDYGVLDAWFLLHRERYVEGIGGAGNIMIAISCAYCLFLATVHACALGIILKGAMRFAKRRREWVACCLYFVAIAVALGCTHKEFFYAGHQSAFQLALMLLSAVLTGVFVVWLRAGKSIES